MNRPSLWAQAGGERVVTLGPHGENSCRLDQTKSNEEEVFREQASLF